MLNIVFLTKPSFNVKNETIEDKAPSKDIILCRLTRSRAFVNKMSGIKIRGGMMFLEWKLPLQKKEMEFRDRNLSWGILRESFHGNCSG